LCRAARARLAFNNNLHILAQCVEKTKQSLGREFSELPPLAIPATLQDSLMARLDRLAPVREMAQGLTPNDLQEAKALLQELA
jgi:hypothetical protein